MWSISAEIDEILSSDIEIGSIEDEHVGSLIDVRHDGEYEWGYSTVRITIDISEIGWR
jgi:hypothetical protein